MIGSLRTVVFDAPDHRALAAVLPRMGAALRAREDHLCER
jgi:hypothetical protein